MPSLFWHADKEQQGKEQGGESKVSPWQKSTPKLHDAAKTERKEGKEMKRFEAVTLVIRWCWIPKLMLSHGFCDMCLCNLKGLLEVEIFFSA